MKSLKIGFPIAAVWFGMLVGPSLMTGSYGTVYYGPYGALGGIVCMLVAVIVAVILCSFTAEVCRREKVYNFNDFGKAIYGRFAPVLCIVLNLYMTVSVILNNGAILSATGTLMTDMFNLPAWVGMAIMIILTVLLAIFGAEFVRKSSAILSVVLVIGLFGLAGAAIYFNWGNWDVSLSAPVLEGYKLGAGIKAAALLGLYQISVGLHLAAVQDTLKTKSHTASFAVCSVALLMLAYFCGTLMVFPWVSDAAKNNVPMLYVIANHFGSFSGIASWIYTITMFFALLTSAVPVTRSVVATLDRYLAKLSFLKNGILRTVLAGVFLWVISLLLSKLGVAGILGTLYGYMGYISVPLVIVPCCIIMPIRWSRQKKEQLANADVDGV